ncbi:hypothetical protein ZWY2020_013212 [Hordeum vulgare]|nr:hypothetical protein ZWY2020_013212 [Hordeum vulgare]
MSSTTARVLAFVLAAVVCVGATPETTCRGGGGRRPARGLPLLRVQAEPAPRQPRRRHVGAGQVAADVGVLMAGNGAYDIKAMLSGNKAARGPLEQCEALYDRMGSAFAEAYDGIDRRDYATGKAKAGEAASLARRCSDAFARAGAAVRRGWRSRAPTRCRWPSSAPPSQPYQVI